jgi:hypothetical protein
MIRIAWVVVCLAGAQSAAAFGADAKREDLKLGDTTITRAEEVTSGTLTVSEDETPMHGLPGFCRVTESCGPQ